MLETDLGFDTKPLSREEVLALIEANPLNQRLKSFDPSQSIIPIFHYWNCYHFPERNYIVAIDCFWRDQIVGILTYKKDIESHTAELISIGVSKKGRGIGTKMIEVFLAEIKERVTTIYAEISPEDTNYEERWSQFLRRKSEEHNLTLKTIQTS